MKSKQTLKVGDKVKVTNNTDNFYNKVGTIIGESLHFDWIVRFIAKNNGEVTASYYNYELQLITPKKEVKKWKYSRVEWLESHKYLDLPQGAMVDLLAKSTPKKEVKKWKYNRKQILKELNRFECVGFTNADPVHGSVARYKVNGDFNLDSVIKPMLLAKSTPKKKSKEIKEIEPLETRFIQVDGIQPEQTQNNEYFANKINELTDTINLLIKNK